MRGKVNVQDLVQSFRDTRNQSLVVAELKEDTKRQRVFDKGYDNQKITRANTSSNKYDSFLKKYEDILNTVDSFTTQDLMYFFREKARDIKYKYVIANMKRDMGIFKKLQSNYEPKEICLMIEFLFSDEQDYLDQFTLQPTILASNWCNKIYRDSIAWANDEYISDKKKKHQNREWQGDKSSESATIGGWD